MLPWAIFKILECPILPYATLTNVDIGLEYIQ